MKPIEFNVPAGSMFNILWYSNTKDLRRLAQEIGVERLGRTKGDTIDNITNERRVWLRVAVEA